MPLRLAWPLPLSLPLPCLGGPSTYIVWKPPYLRSTSTACPFQACAARSMGVLVEVEVSIKGEIEIRIERDIVIEIEVKIDVEKEG